MVMTTSPVVKTFGLKIALAAAALWLTAIAVPHDTEARAGTATMSSAQPSALLRDSHAVATDLSARRRHYVRVYRNAAAAPVFFGPAIGTIGAVVIEQRRQDYYRQQYFYGGNSYYGGHYYGAPGYYGQGYYSGY